MNEDVRAVAVEAMDKDCRDEGLQVARVQGAAENSWQGDGIGRSTLG